MKNEAKLHKSLSMTLQSGHSQFFNKMIGYFPAVNDSHYLYNRNREHKLEREG